MAINRNTTGSCDTAGSSLDRVHLKHGLGNLSGYVAPETTSDISMPSEAIDNLEWGTDEEWEALDASSPTAAELDIMAANIKKSGLASA